MKRLEHRPGKSRGGQHDHESAGGDEIDQRPRIVRVEVAEVFAPEIADSIKAMKSCPPESILENLKIAPGSVEELASDLRCGIGLVAKTVAELVRAGAIVKYEGRRVEAVLYCLPQYVEEPSWRDHSDLRLGRDYGAFYENRYPQLFD